MWFKCRKTRRDLPLLVSGDLHPSRSLDVRQHLVDCAPCREIWVQLNRTQGVLEEVRAASVPVSHESLWPTLRRQIAQAPQRESNLAGWAPVALLAAACLVVYVLGTNSLPQSPESGSASASVAPLVPAPHDRPWQPQAVPTLPEELLPIHGRYPYALEHAQPVAAEGAPREF
jgi:anti-sigma factor RsiW